MVSVAQNLPAIVKVILIRQITGELSTGLPVDVRSVAVQVVAVDGQRCRQAGVSVS